VELYELEGERSMMKSIQRLKTTMMQGLVMVEGVHEGNDEVFLLEHKHHMIPQTPRSC
jgi:hypothetical protein